jgi:hypothetical protein
MRARCPHAIDPGEQCPLGCRFTLCDRPTHRVSADPALVFDVTIDRSAAAKEICTRCEFFLTHGPRRH